MQTCPETWSRAKRKQAGHGAYAGLLFAKELRELQPQIPIVFYEQYATAARTDVEDVFGKDLETAKIELIDNDRQSITELAYYLRNRFAK